jgi:hypothetical protein
LGATTQQTDSYIKQLIESGKELTYTTKDIFGNKITLQSGNYENADKFLEAVNAT